MIPIDLTKINGKEKIYWLYFNDGERQVMNVYGIDGV